MNITAIILNYKNYNDTRECILSVRNQNIGNGGNIRITVIDNNSKDDSTKRLEQEFPMYNYVYNNENYGFARGVNQGIKLNYEDSDYFLLINNDAVLDKDCLMQMLSVSEGEYLVGPVIFYKKRSDTVWQGGGFFSKLIMNIVVPDKNQKTKPRKSIYVDFLSGCVLLIPKGVIDKIGYFDEKFFFYSEDLDFCLRAKKSGVKLIYRRDSRAWHNIDEIEKSRTNPFVLENLAFGYILLIKKHFRSLKFYGLILFTFLYTPFRLYQILKGGNKLKDLKYWIKGAKKAWKTAI